MVGGLVGRVAGGVPGAGVAVVAGGDGATVTPGCATGDAGAVGVDTASGPAGAAPRPRDATVEVELLGGGTLGGVDPAAGVATCSSLTTSPWARTDAGRSVTSPATIDVAAHTMTVEAAVTATHSPVANRRGMGTFPGWPPATARGLSLNQAQSRP